MNFPRIRLLLAWLFLIAATPAIAAETAQLRVSATVLDRNLCTFNATSVGLDFGGLDPTATVDVTITSSLILRCTGSTAVSLIQLSHDSGLHETSAIAPRMRHSGGASYLPYTVDVSPLNMALARDTNQPVSVTGRVRASDYRVALSGDYNDTISLSVNP